MLFKTITVDVEAEVDLDAREVEFDNPDNRNEYHILNKLYHTKDDLYRHLCDICECGYHEPKESLLNKLKDMM